MLIKMLKSKIHRASVTDANLDYEGSITIDENLIKRANLNIYEKVHVFDITNGNRIETYVIKAPAGSGEICINGAAAHLINPNDRIIILSYLTIDNKELKGYKPTIIKVNKKNKIIN